MTKIFIEMDLETYEKDELLKDKIVVTVKRAFFIEPEIRKIEIVEINDNGQEHD